MSGGGSGLILKEFPSIVLVCVSSMIIMIIIMMTMMIIIIIIVIKDSPRPGNTGLMSSRA